MVMTEGVEDRAEVQVVWQRKGVYDTTRADAYSLAGYQRRV